MIDVEAKKVEKRRRDHHKKVSSQCFRGKMCKTCHSQTIRYYTIMFYNEIY